jgi:hypothetical protein
VSWGAPFAPPLLSLDECGNVLRAVPAPLLDSVCSSCGVPISASVGARVGGLASVGECAPCAAGRKCSCTTPCRVKKSTGDCDCKKVGETLRAVGRSKPNSEIADHEKNVQQLDKDIAAHDPGPGDTLDLANWAAINHMMNGYLLRWGQWKTAQGSDWWWGDDDEAGFATLKAEYNQIRDKLLEYTKGKTSAPPAVVVPPALVEEEKQQQEKGSAGQQLLDTFKGFLWVSFIGAGLYFFIPTFLPRAVETFKKLKV